MSILLEALRKSENSQKPVEPPTIHGNDLQPQETGSIKSSIMLALILISLAIIGWLLWQQYHGEESGYRPPVDLPSGKAANRAPEVPGITKTVPAESVPAEPVPAKSATARKTVTNDASTKPPASQKMANNSSGRARTPVETYEVSTQNYKDMTQEEKDAENAMRKSKAAELRAQLAANKRQSRVPVTPANTQPAPATATAPKAGFGSPPAKADEKLAATNASSKNDSTDDYRSPEPEPIGYWELPDSVRNGVPEIKFSVLVYAENPDNRFVLINGERLVEGEELKPGVKVVDIRRDGVVFSYQMYKFFVKR